MLARLIQIQVHATNIVLNKTSLYKITINYLLSPFFFSISIRSFFLFLRFSIYNNVYSKYCQSISLKTYKRIRFSKKNSYYSMEHMKKKKGLLLLANKLVEKILILAMLKNTINHLLEKTPQN